MPSDTKKYKVAAVGPLELLSGLESLGVVVYHSPNHSTARKNIFEIIEGTVNNEKPFAVLLVVESLLKELSEDDYEKISQNPLPALLSIPDLHSEENSGLEKLRHLTTRAIGSDIFSS